MLVAGCTLFFLVIALLYGFWQEPVYTAGATLSVRSEEGSGAAENFGELLSELQDSEARPRIAEEAADKVGWEDSQSDFNERLEWETVNNEEVEVRFSASNPEEAARAANAYADVFVERIEQREGRLAGGTVTAEAGVVKVAEARERRSGSMVILVAIAAAGGLLVGGIGALVLENHARRWSGSKDAERTLRAPVLGVIPYHPDDLPPRDGGAS